MLIFIFVLWVFLSHIFNFLLVHYTELRLRLVYQSLPIQRTPFTCPNAFADELVICSLNVRGLSNTMKRREIFRWLKTKKCAIFFPQEVHCSKDKEICWTSEWGYSAILSSLSSASAGVSILFNNNFSFLILKTVSDPKGRFIIVDIKTESKTLTLANIYAPNNDDPFFFENVFKHLLTFECEEIILVGDFNLVLDVQKDKTGGNPVTHENSLQKVKYIIDSLDLTDIWLFLNADTKRFTRIGEDEIRRCLFNINNFKGGHLAMLQNEPFTHNITALLFGLIINDAKDLLLHHLLLIARHYIYTCKQCYAPKCTYKQFNVRVLRK